MSAHLKNALSLVSGLLGLALIVLVTVTSCGGGAASATGLPVLDTKLDSASAPPGETPEAAPPAPATEPPVLPDTGAADEPEAVPPSEPAADECKEPLDAIPVEFLDYPAPLSGYLDATQGLDGDAAPGGSALRLWLDDAQGRLAFAYIMDWQTEAAATARLNLLRPADAIGTTIGAGGWQGEDASSAGYPGFRALAYRHGGIIVLCAAGITDPSAVASPMPALEALATGIEACLDEHALSMPAGLSSGLAASAVKGTSLAPSLAPVKLASGMTKSAFMPLDLIKGGKKRGSITFKLEMTMTEEQCEGGVVFIVDVYIVEISLGDDDGDGWGKGAGDIMVGGDISVSFKAGDKVSSGKAGPFATSEIGDMDANSTAKEGDDGTELPRFTGSVKGCGIPSKVDFDILVRDSDEGTEFKDIVGAGGTAAAEYLVGAETAKRIGEAIDKAGDKPKDESGTPGMKVLRDREGDDIGEAHDKQVEIEAK